MLAKIGNLLGRKPVTPATPAVGTSTSASAGSRPAMQRRAENPRDTYARIFRWKPTADLSEKPVSVEIAGSFTRWQTVSLTHDPVQQTWTVTIQGIQGKKTHHYVMLVNGKPVHDPACDGLALPQGFEEEQFALPTEKGPRVLMLFAQTK